MNILMLCYYFPPLMDVGCKRSVAFAEYFKKHGWNPLVISVRNPDKNYCLIGKDVPPEEIAVEYSWSVCNIYFILGKLNGLLARLLRLVNIKLTRNYLVDLICFPDIFLGWIPLTLVKGVQAVKRQRIEVIYVSCSPFSSAIIGVLLKKITKKPLVVDFRDPFALNELTSIIDTPRWRTKINKIIEAWIIKSSNIFIVNTEEVKTAYLERHPVARDKTYAVTNGFDFKYLNNDDLAKFKQFTIIYAGLFYFFDKRNDIHTDAFFGSLAMLKTTKRVNKENFQFLYFGDERERLYEVGRKYSVEDLMVCNERRPYSEILKHLKQSHLQLLRISKPMISTKLFEGIALNVPFLATIPVGEVERMIRNFSPASYIITEQSPEKTAEAILDARACYENGQLVDNNVDEFERQFSRENLSLKLMEIINENLHIKRADSAKSETSINKGKLE